MLQTTLLRTASPLDLSSRSSACAIPASHSATCRLRSTSLPSHEAENPSSKSWRGVSQAQAQAQDQSAVASDDGLKWWERDLGAHVRDLHSAQDLTDAISEAQGNLVIVEFFASWCGSCRALYPKLCKIATEHQDIVFVKINFDENKALCKSLNVKVLPYFHFYKGSSEQLESFSCSITKLQQLKDAIAKYDIRVNSEDGSGVGNDETNISMPKALDEQQSMIDTT